MAGDDLKGLTDMSLEELWQLFPIFLRAHNPAYAQWYDEEKTRLLHVLGDCEVCRLSHIGSTAVAGLVAKPIVDMLLELPQNYDQGMIAALLQQNSWILMQQDEAQQTIDLNKGYTPQGFEEKVFHLHVKPWGDWGELYFRDYLRQHPAVAGEYGALKERLGNRFEHNRDAYTGGKTEFVGRYTQKARLAYGPRYRPQRQGAPGAQAGGA